MEEEGQQPAGREIEEGGGIHSQWIGLLVRM